MTADPSKRCDLFIGGKSVPSSGNQTTQSVNPATEEVLAIVAEATPSDLATAVDAASAASAEWCGLPWPRRSRALAGFADALEARAEEFARLDVADSGNPITAMRNDVAGGIQELRFYAGLSSEVKGSTQPRQAGSLTFTQRSPYGVVGRLVPFNHPFKAAIGKIGAPLAAGNAVILKPSEYTPLSALEMAKVSADFLPPGLLSVLTGVGRGIGAQLVAHPGVPRISFTGSVPSGQAVLHGAADNIKHVTVELGGKNPFILFPDADLRRAADAAVKGMNLARSAGQSCQSTSRIYVHSDIRDAFLDSLLERVSQLRVGDPQDDGVDVGPMSFSAHFERVLRYISSASSQGATLLCGGGRPSEFQKGYFIEPTVFADVDDSMTIAREEIFGPVMSVLTWTDVDDVLARANDTPFGLTANIWTNDISRALSTAASVDAGYVFVNSTGKRPLGAPFGGWKSSGLGKGSSLEELLSYTREKSITIDFS